MLFASRIKRAIRCCSTVLAIVSLLCPMVSAQAPEAGLTITILDGENAMNNIRQRTAREPIVQVEDENHKPVAGAAVVFLLPTDGAGGVFPGGAHTLTTLTDSKGQAIARGLRPNHIAGRYQIRVQASYQGKTAQAQVDQTNTSGGSASSSSSGFPKWLAIVVAGVVAGTIAAIATHGGSNPSSNVPIAVTPGTGSVGAPR